MPDVTPAAGSAEPAAPAPGTPAPAAAPPAPPAAPVVAAPAPAGAEQKPAGQEPAPKGDGFLADVTKKDGTEPPPPAPAAEAYELAMPEGVNADADLLKGFTTKAVELGVKKEQAQALVDVYVQRYLEQSKTVQAEAEKRAADNRKALEAHPDIGGTNLEKSKGEARRAIVALDQQHGGLGTRIVQKLAGAGFGDDPDIAHLLTNLGRQMAEDRAPGAAPSRGSSNGVTREEARLAKRYPSIKGIQVPGT